MFLLLTSFLAGILTVFAPCVLILLPVIVGSSLAIDGNKKADRLKPYIIAISLGISVLVFTLLLKASTVLIGIDPQVWKSVSGGIVVVLGLSLLFPLLWAKAMARVGLETSSNSLLSKASKRSGIAGYILTGAALGPVFSACSPVYALILATVLPVNLALGLVYMALYAAGLTLALLAIALAGRRLTKHLNWTAKPDGWFRRVLAIILILVGLAVITGFDKKVQTWILVHTPINSTKLEEKLVPNKNPKPTNKEGNQNTMFNVVKPYPAPELTGIHEWINSNGETLKNLKGKVVLIDFWTYSCINCQRTLPHVTGWYEKYKDKGFVVLGIHAPEFAFEQVPANVKKAVAEDHINYPVGLDNDFSTWNAFKNEYWPAEFFIDKNGLVRHTHFGEGKYSENEAVIQALLKENGQIVSGSIDTSGDSAPVAAGQTPETYLGYERGQRFANSDQVVADNAVNYTLNNQLQTDKWSLGGNWQIGAKQTTAVADGSVLRLKFSAKEVYLVMDAPSNRPITLKLNGKAVTTSSLGGSDVDEKGQVYVDGARLYRLIKSPKFLKDAVLDITVPQGTIVNAFTFGG